MKGEDRPKAPGGDRNGGLSDMAAWSDFLIGLRPDVAPSDNPARTVLDCLSVQDALVAELAAGLDRPEAQWPPDWKTRVSGRLPGDLTSPQLLAVMPVSRALALRATAAARCGEVGKAHEGLRILIKISKATSNEQLLGMLLDRTVAGFPPSFPYDGPEDGVSCLNWNGTCGLCTMPHRPVRDRVCSRTTPDRKGRLSGNA